MYLSLQKLTGLGLLISSLFSYGNVTRALSDNDWPEIPVPENSSLIVVAENMIFNGLPMKTWELRVLMTPTDLKTFYVNAWADRSEGLNSDSPGHLVKTIPRYTVISRIETEYMLTVQIEDRKTESSQAYLAVSKIINDVNSDYVIGEGFPVLTGTVFINDIKAKDGNKESRTIIATSEAPLQSLASFYRSAMTKGGWIEITKNIAMSNKGGAMIFQRNKEEMNITLSPRKNIVNIVAVMVDS